MLRYVIKLICQASMMCCRAIWYGTSIDDNNNSNDNEYGEDSSKNAVRIK